VLARAVLLLWLAMVLNPHAIAQEIRIGVLGLFHPRQLTLQASRKEAVILQAAGHTFVLEPGSPTTVSFHISNDALTFEFGDVVLRTAEVHAAARNGGACAFLLTVRGKVTRAYRGTLVVRASLGEVVPIITMDLETAVASAVAAESRSGTPPEALKAQAVVARSYFLAGGGRHREFDFCDLTHCQFLRELPAQDSPAAVAARETHGIVLTFEEKPFAPMFSRSCGGHTRTPADVGLPGSAYPYFSVLCNFCYKSPYRWTRRLSLQDAALLGKGESGRLAVDRRLGWNTVPSNDFTSRQEGELVILEGAGQGHGIGLCQRGAEVLAAEGSSFRQILNHYFPNTSLMRLGERVAGPTVHFQSAQEHMDCLGRRF
jgi:stage II sporulation protein D (peptidoglycan lytic transglycosylase)